MFYSTRVIRRFVVESSLEDNGPFEEDITFSMNLGSEGLCNEMTEFIFGYIFRVFGSPINTE